MSAVEILYSECVDYILGDDDVTVGKLKKDPLLEAVHDFPIMQLSWKWPLVLHRVIKVGRY
jgi:hypothetical protein